MWKDPIVEDVRRIRDEHARRFGYDLGAICRDLREQQSASQRRVVILEPRRRSDETCPRDVSSSPSR